MKAPIISDGLLRQRIRELEHIRERLEVENKRLRAGLLEIAEHASDADEAEAMARRYLEEK
jgi:hypothetical protein